MGSSHYPFSSIKFSSGNQTNNNKEPFQQSKHSQAVENFFFLPL